jgi:hypothetical protein
MKTQFMIYQILPVLLIFGLIGCGDDSEVSSDLGDFYAPSKADEIVVVEVPFEVEQDSEIEFTFRTIGFLKAKISQDRSRSWERLQIVAESSTYRRKSWRGRKPFLRISLQSLWSDISGD